MAKTFFKLKGAYEGLQARRLKWTGRLVLYQIINDGPAYFLLQIQNFDPVKDRLAAPTGNGTFRFVDAASANRKYEQLASFFPPRIYKVPVNNPARMAELRALKGKSLRRSEQGSDLVPSASYAFRKPAMPVDQYIAEVMENACN
jgi:hypothetical protein